MVRVARMLACKLFGPAVVAAGSGVEENDFAGLKLSRSEAV